MKLILPEYCKKFRCIADKCSDNCCIGWEICIDDRTFQRYKTVGGEFGKRLESSVDSDEQCFINDGRERCPFLNGNNLCDIIITLGEDFLCDICDRHPRWFEWFGDCIEGGIGLCCEEAARLILGSESNDVYAAEAPERLCADCGTDDEYDVLFCEFLRSARRNIIGLIGDTSIPLDETLSYLVSYAEVLQEHIDEYEIDEAPSISKNSGFFDTGHAISLMLDAETADNEQAEYLNGLRDFFAKAPDTARITDKNERELRNIAVYFVRRYLMKAVYSGNLYPKILLAVFAVRVINVMLAYDESLHGELDLEQKCRTAKLFSKIIEYSEENLKLIYEEYIF